MGGQGAPLVPLVHQALFHSHDQDRIILNIGGIANASFLPADKDTVFGFDTGPGNTLLDSCAREFLQKPYDGHGQFAASGTVNPVLLEALLNDPYFKRTPPKSTGREYFNMEWVRSHITSEIEPADLQATLAELTAKSIANAIDQLSHHHPDIFICGGGVHNDYLLERLAKHCAPSKIQSTHALGVDPDWIEALLFAWLAKQTVNRLPGNAPCVTGASRASVLGGIYYP